MSEIIGEQRIPSTSLQPVAPTPLDLLQTAFKAGWKPDEMKQLMDMARDWQEKQGSDAFELAMCDAQQDMPSVAFNAHNSQTKSDYANLSAVNKAIMPVVTRHGLNLKFGEDASPLAGHVRVVCDVGHRSGYSRRYHLDLPLDGVGIKGNPNMTPLQGKGSTLSYARRYLTCLIFNLAIGDDNDGNGETPFINRDQIRTINTMIDSLGDKIDFKRFLDVFKIEGLEQMPMTTFDKAVDMLNRKAKQ